MSQYGEEGERSGEGVGSGRGGGAGPGASVHLTFNAPIATDHNSTQQLFDQWSQEVRNGTLALTASTAAVQGPTASGRG